MEKNERILIYVLLVIIVICSFILYIKIKIEPRYNKELYDEIYSDYDEIFPKRNMDDAENDEYDEMDESITNEGNNENESDGLREQPNLNNNSNQTINENTTVRTTNKKVYMTSDGNGKKYRIIGKISIPKIEVYYPIIYETTDEYLKIAPTKYCGPNINEVGNLCVLGHNYYNNQFFSRLSELENGDRVMLMPNEGGSKRYLVYNKYIINKDDLSCTNQDTNGKIELTLVTCVKFDKSKRLVVKCRAEN